MGYYIKRVVKGLLVLSEYSPVALVWMVKAMVWDLPMQRLMRPALIREGNKLGLDYKPSDYMKEFGKIVGRKDGFQISIKPEDSMNSTIEIESLGAMPQDSRRLKMEFSTQKPYMREKKQVTTITTPHRIFNRVFKTKCCHQDLNRRLLANERLFQAATDFYLQFMQPIVYLDITETRIYCKLQYNFYFYPFIPARQLAPLIMGLLAIAKARDNTFR